MIQRPTFELQSLEARQLFATVPAGFVDELVTGGLVRPTRADISPDGQSILVAEKAGNLRLVQNGTLLPDPVLSVSVDTAGERGLTGVLFHPDFAENGHIYIFYTRKVEGTPLHNRLSRFTMTGTTAAAETETVILDFEPQVGALHNAGDIHFGPDGKLYVAVGDNTVKEDAQKVRSRLGKILRINPDGSIPTDNPFYASATGVNRAIYAVGLRNPYSFDFQPGTERLFINDVGENKWEEINEGVAGGNYGWPVVEGPSNNPRFIGPVHAYQHDTGDNSNAITGGIFYNPPNLQFPKAFQGQYLFADFGGGYIKRLASVPGSNKATVTPFATGLILPTDLDVHPDGSVYYVQFGANGSLRRIRTAAVTKPAIVSQPAGTSTAVGKAATFSVTSSGPGPVSYQWRRNGVKIEGATGPTYTVDKPTLADSGSLYRVVITNPFGSVISRPAALKVVQAKPPTVNLSVPSGNYQSGQRITFSATGTDFARKALPASAFDWVVKFVDRGASTVVATADGKSSISFTPPFRGPQTSTSGFYRVTVTATDAGLQRKITRQIKPEVVKVTIRPSTPGPAITINDKTSTNARTFKAVVGSRHVLSIDEDDRDRFIRWSDGITKPQRMYVVPRNPAPLTAIFR